MYSFCVLHTLSVRSLFFPLFHAHARSVSVSLLSPFLNRNTQQQRRYIWLRMVKANICVQPSQRGRSSDSHLRHGRPIHTSIRFFFSCFRRKISAKGISLFSVCLQARSIFCSFFVVWCLSFSYEKKFIKWITIKMSKQMPRKPNHRNSINETSFINCSRQMYASQTDLLLIKFTIQNETTAVSAREKKLLDAHDVVSSESPLSLFVFNAIFAITKLLSNWSVSTATHDGFQGEIYLSKCK